MYLYICFFKLGDWQKYIAFEAVYFAMKTHFTKNILSCWLYATVYLHLNNSLQSLCLGWVRSIFKPSMYLLCEEKNKAKVSLKAFCPIYQIQTKLLQPTLSDIWHNLAAFWSYEFMCFMISYMKKKKKRVYKSSLNRTIITVEKKRETAYLTTYFLQINCW